MTEFSPIWYTIEEMKHAKPLCMYHKEQDALEEKNNEMKNLHVMAKAHFLRRRVRLMSFAFLQMIIINCI